MKIISFLMILTLLFFSTGCEEFREALEDGGGTYDDPTSENFRPRFVVGIFSIVEYPRASDLEKELPMSNGRSIWINTNQNFSSKNLREVRVIPRPGNPDICDLQFKLDRQGKVQWQILAGNNQAQPVVLVVDSRYAGRFIPELPEDSDSREHWVTLRVGVDHYTARGIAKFAKKNYVYYNPDTASWFNFLFEESSK
jgi:hypothetical protein